MADIPLRILLSMTGANAITSALGPIASALGPAGIVGAALVAFGASSVKQSADFQNAMLQNEAHAGLAVSQVQNVNQALLAMGPAVGQGPTQLAEALYPILSGFSGINNQAAKTQVSLTELRLAAQSVAGSTTSVTTVSNAATASFNALGLASNNSATNIQRMNWLFDVMNTTVSSGNMHWQDYANVAGKLATAIKGTGVSFVEANAALATMTNEGFSAQRSQTYLANLFTQLDLKTDAMAKHAAKLGVAFDEQKFKTMSLAQQVDYLNKITHGNQSEILALLGGNATALKTFNALEAGMKSYKNNLDALNHSHGATAQAFAVASQGYNFALARLGASFQSLQISIGNIFLPMLTTLINAMVPVVSGLATWVATNHTLTDSITNASTGLQPAMRHLRDMSMDLYQTLAYWLTASMPTLRQQFQLTANIAQTQFLPALQGTSNWMVNTGTPVYAAFAKLVRDILSGSFRQAGKDAIQMGIDITQALQGLPAKLQGIKLPKLKLDVTLPNLDLKTGGLGNLALLFAPLLALQPQLQGFANWLNTTFGPAFNTVFGPIGDMIHRVTNDMKPWVDQLMLLFNQIFPPGKAQGMSASIHGLGGAWKELWVIIGDMIEVGMKLDIIFTMDILPALGHLRDAVQWVADKFSGANIDASHFLDGMHNVSNWINTSGVSGFLNLSNVVNEAGLGVGQFAQDAWSSIQQEFAPFPQFMKDLAAQVEAPFAPVPDWFKTQWNRISDGFKISMNGVGNFASNAAGSLVGIWRSAFNGVIDVINGMISRIDSISVAGFGVHIALLPHLASGGHLISPGLALVGERGPEVVALPGGSTVFPSGTGPAGYGGGVTNIFYISLSTMARSQAEVQRLVDMVEQEIGNRMRAQTPGYNQGLIF